MKVKGGKGEKRREGGESEGENRRKAERNRGRRREGANTFGTFKSRLKTELFVSAYTT